MDGVIWQISAGGVILVLDLGNVVKVVPSGGWIIGNYPTLLRGVGHPGFVVVPTLRSGRDDAGRNYQMVRG